MPILSQNGYGLMMTMMIMMMMMTTTTTTTMMMMNNDSKSAKKISEPQIRAKLANIERPLPWVAWTCKGLAPSAQVGAGCSPELRAKMAPDAPAPRRT